MRRPPNLMTSLVVAEKPPAPAVPAPPRTYLELYGLSKPPFSGGAYVLFGSHRRAFDATVNHILNGHGVAIVHGEEGSGKTELLRAAAREANVPVVWRSATDELQDVLSDAGSSEPRKVVLIDDADRMTAETLVVLLSAVRRIPEEKGGLAIVLSATSGWTEPTLTQIAGLARNTIRLGPLGPAEVRQHIERSLWIAGGTTRRLIAPDAMRQIVARSGGLPGRTNRLLDAVLTAGFARGDEMINAKTVAAAIGPAPPRIRRAPSEPSVLAGRVAAIVATGLFALGAAAFLYRGLTERPPAAKPAPVATQEPKPAALPPDLVAALRDRGDRAVGLGDIVSARLLYQRAAEAGDRQAEVGLGKTYDPAFVAPGQAADPARAAVWYRKAAASGDAQAAELLRRLHPPASPQASPN